VKIANEIRVAAPPQELFDILADVERVAPCMPGACLEGRDGDSYNGGINVRVGPINARYKGRLRFEELDKDGLRAVMKASGSEVDGQGNAEATISATIEGADSESLVKIDSDLQVRGRAAQFGRGVLANVSQRLVEEFARNLEASVLDTEEVGGKEQPAREEETPRPPRRDEVATSRPSEPEAPLDALSMYVAPMLKSLLRSARARSTQYGPALGGFAVGLLVGRLLARRRVLPVVHASADAIPGGGRRGFRRRV
jgi:carbon monoxide dehydrogenase subunit G